MRFLPSLISCAAAAAFTLLALALPGAAGAATTLAQYDKWNDAWWGEWNQQTGEWTDAGDKEPAAPTPADQPVSEPAPQTTWDGAGSGWGDRPRRTSIGRLRYLLVDNKAISPNGDGHDDAVGVSFWLTGSLTATVTVTDAAGGAVRQLGTFTKEGKVELAWDAKNDAGAQVADGAYSLVIKTASLSTAGSTFSAPLLVDATAPALKVKRPTLAQLQAAARRAAASDWARSRSRGHGKRKGHKKHRRWEGRGNEERDNRGGGNGRHGWGQSDWYAAYGSSIPLTFTVSEAANVSITATLARRRTDVNAWRVGGTQRVNVLLPQYRRAGKLTVVVTARDDAGNARRSIMVVRLPEPPRRQRSAGRPDGATENTTPAPDIPVGSASGPLPDWLDPIMLRATYGAGVPQSWARSQALANLLRGESSFRPTAQNPTSTAYGLFQFLDQTWAGVGCRKTSDPYMQSVCGLRYIQRRYRTPERAWAFWQRQSPHWY